MEPIQETAVGFEAKVRDVVLLECAPLRDAISTSLLGVSLVQRDAYAVRHAVFEKKFIRFCQGSLWRLTTYCIDCDHLERPIRHKCHR